MIRQRVSSALGLPQPDLQRPSSSPPSPNLATESDISHDDPLSSPSPTKKLQGSGQDGQATYSPTSSSPRNLTSRPPEVDHTSTRALSQFLRVTGPESISPPPIPHIPDMMDAKSARSPSLKSRKSRNFATAAKHMGKESLAIFRRKRQTSVTSGITNGDSTSPRTSLPLDSPAATKPSPSGHATLLLKSPESYSLPAIFRSGTRRTGLETPIPSPSSSFPLLRSPSTPLRSGISYASDQPSNRPPSTRSGSFEVTVDEYDEPTRISIDGHLGDFRPSPVVASFPEGSVARNKLRFPEESSPVVAQKPSSSDGDGEEDDEVESSPFNASHSASSFSTVPSAPKETTERPSTPARSAEPMLKPPTSAALLIMPTPLDVNTSTVSTTSPYTPPLSPPPSMPLPLLPSASNPSFASVSPQKPASSSIPAIDEPRADHLQEQITSLYEALASQSSQISQLSTHVVNILQGFESREQWFKARVESLEKEKFSWEKEREGLRWLLAVGQSPKGSDDEYDADDRTTTNREIRDSMLILSPPIGRRLRRSRTLPSLPMFIPGDPNGTGSRSSRLISPPIPPLPTTRSNIVLTPAHFPPPLPSLLAGAEENNSASPSTTRPFSLQSRASVRTAASSIRSSVAKKSSRPLSQGNPFGSSHPSGSVLLPPITLGHRSGVSTAGRLSRRESQDISGPGKGLELQSLEDVVRILEEYGRPSEKRVSAGSTRT